MSSQVTLDMPKGADTESFPVIDLGDFFRGEQLSGKLVEA
jgi:hypothetical protein